MTTQLTTDYLIIGAGASAMAFADIIISESNATVLFVDTRHKPGGHWNDAYSFVTLHQPSAFYGVSSKELSKGTKDKVGLNKGMNGLASGAEINAYYDDLMRETFLPSGRVQYFPKCRYTEDGKFVSLLTGDEFSVSYKKLVDTTYYNTTIPSTHTPGFDIDSSVRFMPLNDLPSINSPVPGYTVIGGGKTGIDACLWLLENGIEPDNITWIMPRDAWFLDRKNTQPTPDFFFDAIGAQADQMEAIAESESIDDMFARLEKAGVFLRLDESVWPKMFHGATISALELEQLRRIKNVVRKGRVERIEPHHIVLQEGDIPTTTDIVHVDCTASAISNLDISPIFAGNKISPQTVRSYQPVFSAAFVAHIELQYDDIEKKNKLCKVVPLPNHDSDWVELTYRNLMNQYFWSKEPGLKDWLKNNRLDGFMRLVASVKFYEFEKLKVLNRMRKAAKPAIAKLKQYRASLGTE
ncbi:MAG: NAD(P)/FAD-dependent oxidoreductase [Alteromonadaceae bacterium]|nr:NAD(P)/FAD-dependent oxidoreductase [Alteromonadaceae bacterium]